MSSSSSSSSIPTPYIYILLLPPSGGMLAYYLLLSLAPPLKICIPFVAVLKKSKRRQAKTPLLTIRSAPIALAAFPADFSSSSIFHFSIKNLSNRTAQGGYSVQVLVLTLKLVSATWNLEARLSIVSAPCHLPSSSEAASGDRVGQPDNA